MFIDRHVRTASPQKVFAHAHSTDRSHASRLQAPTAAHAGFLETVKGGNYVHCFANLGLVCAVQNEAPGPPGA
eukprot:2741-Pyramimonas_sp.AAC.1